MTTHIDSGPIVARSTRSDIAAWVAEIADLTAPRNVVWCDGSDEEWNRLTEILVDKGTFVRLEQKPNSFRCVRAAFPSASPGPNRWSPPAMTGGSR